LNPVHDGAVCRFYTNGYKIANPTIWRAYRRRNSKLDARIRYTLISSKEDPLSCTAHGEILDDVMADSHIQTRARSSGLPNVRPADDRLKDSEGLDGPKEVDGLLMEGYWRSTKSYRRHGDKPGISNSLSSG